MKEKITDGNKYLKNYYRNEKILNVLYLTQLVLAVIILIGWIVWAVLKSKGY